MAEQMTVVIKGRDGLTVEDAMRQVLETFELLDRTNPSPNRPVQWRLLKASTNTPLTVVGEAVGAAPGFDVEQVARAQKVAFLDCFAELRAGKIPPVWSEPEPRRIVKALLHRITNGIAETDIFVGDSQAPLTLTAQDARQALPMLNAEPVIGHPSVQIGSVEGFLHAVTTFRRKPAIRIQDRRTHADVVCLVSEEFRARVSSSATLDDVWRERRVIIRGRIHYDATGAIEHVAAGTIDFVPDTIVDSDQIKDRHFTDGLSAEEYLNRFRDGEIG